MADFGMVEERFEPKRDIWKNREVSMKKNGKGAKDPNRLGFGTLLKYKSSDVAQAGIQAIVIGFLSAYCTDTLGMNPASVGILLMASKIVDAITDIFAGWLVDNTHTKFGKGRPYDLCIVGVTLCSVLLFSGNPAWSGLVKNVWVFLMYTLVFAVFTTMRNAANTPYTIRIFHNNEILIRKVASYGGIITMLGAIVINMLFPIVMARFATSAAGWRITILIFAVPLTILGVIRFFTLKEDPSVDAGSEYKKISVKEIFTMFRKNPYVWLYALIMLAYNVTTSTGIGAYYYKYIIGNYTLMSVASALSIVMLPVMFIFPVIMRKLGSMSRMVFWFSFLGMAGYILVFFANTSFPLLILGSTIGVLATMPLAYYGVLFIMRICTYNQMVGLDRMDASAGILSNFSAKVGSALGSMITGLLLAASGYISSSGSAVVAQPDSAIMMIRFIMAGVPFIALIIVAVCVRRFEKLEMKLIPEWEAKQKEASEAAEMEEDKA